MLKTTLKAGALALGLALGATSGLHAQDAKEINFGVISTEASANQKVNWDPFVAAMSKATGLKINAFYASDYAGIIEAMRFNKVQVAWYGNKSAIEAVDRAEGEVFAQVLGKDGGDGYTSHLITNVDKPFKTADDVLKCDKSLDFGNGDPNSTSGFLIPAVYVFAPKKIDVKTCFKTVRNANHQANAMAVANNQVDVATNNSEDLSRLEASAPDARKKIKILWTSPAIPLDPIVWRKDLDAGAKGKLYSFLMSYGRTGTPEEIAEARKVLAALQWSPMRPSTNHQLVTIRKLEANKKLMSLAADDKVPADEKAKKSAELEATVAKLTEQETKVATDAAVASFIAFGKLDAAKDADAIKKVIAAGPPKNAY
jgi:phosphonate transport system substrate-binding protein